jgi:hypothetical protein
MKIQQIMNWLLAPRRVPEKPYRPSLMTDVLGIVVFAIILALLLSL